MNPPARVRRAPEHFLDATQIAEVQAGRRDFLRGAFLAAAGVAAGAARAAEGDPAILELPEHSKSLGQPVATLGYGQPSKHEKDLLRRESPGLTRVGGSSASSRPTACTSSATTRAGGTSTRTSIGSWSWAWCARPRSTPWTICCA